MARIHPLSMGTAQRTAQRSALPGRLRSTGASGPRRANTRKDEPPEPRQQTAMGVDRRHRRPSRGEKRAWSRWSPDGRRPALAISPALPSASRRRADQPRRARAPVHWQRALNSRSGPMLSIAQSRGGKPGARAANILRRRCSRPILRRPHVDKPSVWGFRSQRGASGREPGAATVWLGRSEQRRDGTLAEGRRRRGQATPRPSCSPPTRGLATSGAMAAARAACARASEQTAGSATAGGAAGGSQMQQAARMGRARRAAWGAWWLGAEIERLFRARTMHAVAPLGGAG